ncbi:MAG: potassium transporter TrkG, partial [Candidatus Kapaibacterium sp.]
GFSTKNASIAYYSDSYIDYVLIVFMLIAGTNFTLIYKLMKGDLKSLFNSGEFKIYISIVAISSAFIAYHLYSGSGNDVASDIKYALFQVSSIITTTGFINADYEQWSSSSQLILMTLMFIGGCAGSTAGGLKVIRLIILLKFMYNELKRLIHPQAIIHVKFGNFTVDNKVLANVVGFFTVYVVIAVMSTIVISSFGIDFVSSLGAVSATLNNVGPGFGDLGPTDNFSALPAVVKWILSFLMMLGRLEIYTVIILITPIFWRK